MFNPELLSPAGTYKNMQYAFAYGADAVYAGQPRYSLRVRNNEFNKLETLRQGIEEAHRQNKQFYIASNLSPHNDKIRSYLKDLAPIIEMSPDALIMSDPGLIMMVREKWPDIPIHLSVQANATNYATVEFWRRQGISRVILSRELSLEEIAEIKDKVPNMELEVFVHGALCIAYSGRCLLSGYMTHRDANQGACTNSCRWQYDTHVATENEVGELIPVQQVQAYQSVSSENNSQVMLLEERNRPGEYMSAYEDEHGTYIMNSKDLRAVQHVHQLAAMGIHSLKIEGRTKSYYYAARTAQVYRKAIDDALANKPFNKALMDELETLSNRGYTEGFYRRHPPAEYQQYERGEIKTPGQQFVGEIIDANDFTMTIDVKNKFQLGDSIQLMTPTENINFTLNEIQNNEGRSIDVAPGSGHIVTIPRPTDAESDDMLKYALLVKTSAL